MNKIETGLDGVYIIEPVVHGDNRGYFMETWSTQNFEELGIDTQFIQDNQSFTKEKGTIRGIHFQNYPIAQAKLVRVATGAVLDFAIDLRKDSPTYRKWVSVVLSSNNKRQLLIPQGFGHLFLTLTDDVTFIYRCDNLYSAENDRNIRYDDPEIGLVFPDGYDNFILSNRDKNAPYLKDSDCNF